MLSTNRPENPSTWLHAKEAEATDHKAHSGASKRDSSTAQFLARIAYRRLGTWDAVAQWYGEHSKSAYHRLATDDHFYPSQEFITLVESHDLPPIRRTILVPDKHDAAVYLTPNGHGDLSTTTVPNDCTVAILPAGARIVEPSATRRQRPDTWTLRLPGEWRQYMTPAEARSILASAVEHITSGETS